MSASIAGGNVERHIKRVRVRRSMPLANLPHIMHDGAVEQDDTSRSTRMPQIVKAFLHMVLTMAMRPASLLQQRDKLERTSLGVLRCPNVSV